jgi:hypothetical protein
LMDSPNATESLWWPLEGLGTASNPPDIITLLFLQLMIQ